MIAGRVLSDLHGFTFKCGDFRVSTLYPRKWGLGVHLVLDRDLITNQAFTLVKTEDHRYGYIFYANSIYVYGDLQLIKYDSNKDMRYVKEQH